MVEPLFPGLVWASKFLLAWQKAETLPLGGCQLFCWHFLCSLKSFNHSSSVE